MPKALLHLIGVCLRLRVDVRFFFSSSAFWFECILQLLQSLRHPQHHLPGFGDEPQCLALRLGAPSTPSTLPLQHTNQRRLIILHCLHFFHLGPFFLGGGGWEGLAPWVPFWKSEKGWCRNLLIKKCSFGGATLCCMQWRQSRAANKKRNATICLGWWSKEDGFGCAKGKAKMKVHTCVPTSCDFVTPTPVTSCGAGVGAPFPFGGFFVSSVLCWGAQAILTKCASAV